MIAGATLQVLQQGDFIVDISAYNEGSLNIYLEPTGCIDVLQNCFPSIFAKDESKKDCRAVQIRVPDMKVSIAKIAGGACSVTYGVIDGDFRCVDAMYWTIIVL